VNEILKCKRELLLTDFKHEKDNTCSVYAHFVSSSKKHTIINLINTQLTPHASLSQSENKKRRRASAASEGSEENEEKILCAL
jgi:hypothetical protein